MLSTLTGKQLKERAEKLQLNYACGEIFPGNEVLCIVPFESKIELKTMKWGISRQINARLETLSDKAYYRELKDRRCALIANGFYEWDNLKQKYYIVAKEDYIYLAGVFNKKDELLIITKEATGELKAIHERMPLVMNRGEMLAYIHGKDLKISDKKLSVEAVLNKQLSLF